MARRKQFEYRNPDGTLKILKVVERLPDGTRIFEDGSRALPSVVCMPDGTEKRLMDMDEKEYTSWNNGLLDRLSRDMSDFYRDNTRRRANA
jgi:hypothetical protein